MIVNKKVEGTCRIVNFALPVNPRVKIKEGKNRDKKLDHAREQKQKFWT